jgi:hypothetical protein
VAIEHFTVSSDLTLPLAVLKNSQKRRSYALANALNNTAKLGQAAVREGLPRTFTLRKPDFLMRQAAIIKPFASGAQGRLQARVYVGEPTRLLLSEYESGGRRLPFKGRRVAVPITGGPARPSKRAGVTEPFTFRAMRLTKVRAGIVIRGKSGRAKHERKDVNLRASRRKGGAIQWKGTSRTFVLQSTSRAPEGGVYQRVGPGKGDIRLVYSFAQNVKLRPVLKFHETMRRVIYTHLEAQVRLQVMETLRFNLARRA